MKLIFSVFLKTNSQFSLFSFPLTSKEIHYKCKCTLDTIASSLQKIMTFHGSIICSVPQLLILAIFLATSHETGLPNTAQKQTN